MSWATYSDWKQKIDKYSLYTHFMFCTCNINIREGNYILTVPVQPAQPFEFCVVVCCDKSSGECNVGAFSSRFMCRSCHSYSCLIHDHPSKFQCQLQLRVGVSWISLTLTPGEAVFFDKHQLLQWYHSPSQWSSLFFACSISDPSKAWWKRMKYGDSKVQDWYYLSSKTPVSWSFHAISINPKHGTPSNFFYNFF